jgi:formyl-CoA transferase
MSMAAVAGLVGWQRNDDGYVEMVLGGGGGAMFGGVTETAFAIAAALFRRASTGQGAYIDVGVSDASVNVPIVSPDRLGVDETGMTTAAVGGMNPKYNLYESKDGKVLLVALIEHHFYEHLCRGIGREDLLEEGVGFSTTAIDIDWGPESLRSKLRDVFLTRTSAEWMEFAAAEDVVIAPVNGPEDLATDPHLSARGAVVTTEHPTAGTLTYRANPVKVAGEEFEIFHQAPSLGEDTDDILRELGYDDARVAALREAGVVNG